ncbi:acylneuraminate cytidylyltransferase family protein [Candidatus Pelagibacter sp.]|nr:acylneuraminate cytidylyltransferase family protein [Candidatus Pelagibacter sp.]
MKKKKYLCIIPARAGSKGIKNKNFQKINNKPLIQYSIDTAKKLEKYCDIIISSDSKKIKKICLNNKIKFYGYRPKFLSGDNVQTYKVVKYELDKVEKLNKEFYKGILLLQPTCPIRDVKKIIKAFKILSSKKYDSLVSVTSVDAFHPVRMKKFKKKYLVNYLKTNKENMLPRQKLSKIYIRSGSIYLIKRNSFIKNKSLVGKRCYGLILQGLESTNIDTKFDLELLKLRLKK